MSLIGLVVLLSIIGFLLCLIEQIPLDPTIRNLDRIILIVILTLWLVSALGLLDGQLVIRFR